MSVTIAKTDVWSGEIPDRAGGLAEKIEAVASAGANLEFVIARRGQGEQGGGLVFMAPLHGVAQSLAARAAGLAKAPDIHTLRLEGADRPGLGAKITRVVADAGINMRGLSAMVLGRRYVVYLSFDNGADANRAKRILNKVFEDS
jgi:hypothetical protein